MTYNSPIELIYDKMTMNIEDEIVTAVQRLNINVNKEELIKALEYDRGQYKKGYEDAMADAIPVEWIKKFTEESKRHIQDSVNNYIYMYDYMLSEWERRKEE